MKDGPYVIAVLSLLACSEPIRLDTNAVSDEIIISGSIVQNKPPEVFIRRAGNSKDTLNGVSDAIVVAHESGGNTAELTYKSRGLYIGNEQTFTGKIGHAYWIEVRVNDQLFVSRPDTLPDRVEQVEISWMQVQKPETTLEGIDVWVDAVQLSLESRIDSGFFRYWKVEETIKILPTDLGFPYDPFGLVPDPCYATFPASSTIHLSSVRTTSEIISIENMSQRELDKSFLFKHIFSIQSISVSESFYLHLVNLRSLNENVGSLFDSPPAKITGNIYPANSGDPLPGYFAALNQGTYRIAIFPDDLELDESIVDDCLWNPEVAIDFYGQNCLDCTSIPGATENEPEFWGTTN